VSKRLLPARAGTQNKTNKPMKTKLMIITPAIAKQWLEQSNTDNRRLRQTWVEQLARDMRRGVFVTTHQGIAFADDGTLLDGQHRLAAVVLSGKAIEMIVTTGLPKVCSLPGLDLPMWDVIDKGGKRSDSDSLKRLGLSDPSTVAASIRCMFYAANGSTNLAISLTQIELALEIVGSSVTTCVALGSGKGLLLRMTSAMTAASSFLHLVQAQRAEDFIKEATNITGAMKCPTRALATWGKNHPPRGGGAQLHTFSATASALHAYCESRPLSKLYGSETSVQWLLDISNSAVKKLRAIIAL
jgi:hypothetical protein